MAMLKKKPEQPLSLLEVKANFYKALDLVVSEGLKLQILLDGIIKKDLLERQPGINSMLKERLAAFNEALCGVTSKDDDP